MSTGDLYYVYKNQTRHIVEFRNGWGTAPALWGHLCENILHIDSSSWITGGEDQRKLWDLAIDPNVSKEFRLVHAFTFDRAICPLERREELALECESVYRQIVLKHPNHINHWNSIAVALKVIKPPKKAKGIGLSCTSVSDPWIDWKGGDTWDIFDIFKQVA